MSKYNFPDLEPFKILYKGRRYIAFELIKNLPFDEFVIENDFVVWDGLYDTTLSYGTYEKDGTYKGFLAYTVVEVEIEKTISMKEFVEKSKKEQARYFKECGT